jgi:hypothetical protein
VSLTELAIKKLVSKEKRRLVHDERGLYLEIHPNGNKFWKYRWKENGKEHKMSLGEYPLISLRQAREARDEIRVDRLKGISPLSGASSGKTVRGCCP